MSAQLNSAPRVLPTPDEIADALPKEEGWGVREGWRSGAYNLYQYGRPTAHLCTAGIEGVPRSGWVGWFFGGLRTRVQPDFKLVLQRMFPETKP